MPLLRAVGFAGGQPARLVGRFARKAAAPPVIDRTESTGKYDIPVSFDQYLAEKSTQIDTISTITTGIRQELGLKWVIESAEKAPVEN